MGNGFDNTNQQQQQQANPSGLNATDVYQPPPSSNQPWRPTYGQVAPAYGNTGDGSIGNPNGQQQGQVTYEGGVPVAPRPVQNNGGYQTPYNQTPGVDNTQGGAAYNPGGGAAYNPGGGAAYNPGGGAAYNPGEQQVPPQQRPLGDNGQSGPVWNQPNPNQQSTDYNNTHYNDAPVVKGIGVFPGAVMGGFGGIVGGNLIPNWGNKAAEAILRDAPTVAEGAAAKPGMFEQIFGKAAKEKVTSTTAELGSKFEGLDAGGRVQRAATSWQNQFDPRYQNRTALQDMLNQNNEALSKLAPDAEAATKAALAEKQAILSAGEGPLATKLNPALFTADGKAMLETVKGSTALTEAEANLLKSQATKLNTAFPTAEAASKEMALLERPMVGNFAKGAAFVGGTLLADHIAGNFIGKDGAGHLSNVALPMAFVAGGTWKERAIYSAAAIVGSKTIDALLPASDHTTINRIMAPTGVDSLTMGAAFMLPAADSRTRLAMIGTAWGFGRLRNMNDTESLLTTGGLMGATGLALKVGRINPELGVGLLAAEGGAFVLSRIFKGNTGK
ncbi:MAG: hypothetical protein JST89_04725 [Cyanobacteria bacterium SZAS-4]|nr:hypothetical protein [Cyanobacteria bacterium SZAS-4]